MHGTHRFAVTPRTMTGTVGGGGVGDTGGDVLGVAEAGVGIGDDAGAAVEQAARSREATAAATSART